MDQDLPLPGTPYLVTADVAPHIVGELQKLSTRMEVLRSTGKLSDDTLRLYYGETRFQQIAESNAIEGSTLDVGETQLAVLRGTTLTGHDPGYVRDAQTLARALDHLAELAQQRQPTTISELLDLHGLILGDRPSAGRLRSEPVRISGSRHHPPRDSRAVHAAMQEWQAWSTQNPLAPTVLRAAVLHAWLSHIHPFIDGNGRAARAITTLELVRAGYPPLILRRTRDRDRYIDALQRSDEGDLAPLLDLLIQREDDALRDLERAATRVQGYDAFQQSVRLRQDARRKIWDLAVQTLVAHLELFLAPRVEAVNARFAVKVFRDSLNLDDYIALCERQPISQAWAFRVDLQIPGIQPISRLAWAGFRSEEMVNALPRAAPGPSLFWSEPNPAGYPPWRLMRANGPGGNELTLVDDAWVVRRGAELVRKSATEVAEDVMLALLAT